MVLTVSKYRFQHWLFTLLTAHNVSLKILRAKRYSFEAFSLGTLNRYIQSSSKHQVNHFGMVHLAPAAECIHKVLPLNSKSGCVHIFLFTLLIYTCYHLSRKPLSIVKSVLHQNCSEEAHKKGKIIVPENETFCDWAPFDNQNYDSLFGTLDLIFLSLYAISMFFSGHVADKMDLRIYLCIGTLLSGMTTIAFGLGYFFNIHSFTYYAIVQYQVHRLLRGFFMGVWTAHASIGNILGSLIAGAFVEKSWGWSFIVPGLIIGFFSLPIYFFLVPSISDGNSFEESLGTTTSQSNLLIPIETKSSSFLSALKVPGVVEYSLTLFFSKLVSYTFIFWLPMYIREAGGFNPSSSADLSAVFDLGGILGGIIAGYVSDSTGSSAITCVVMLALSIPTLYLYSIVGFRSLAYCIGLLIPLGLFVNGPYCLITTAVSADLGTHPSLSKNSRTLATVTGIIDGTGSVGAALGPLLCGLLKPYGWSVIIIMLMVALALAAILLFRMVANESRHCCFHSEQSLQISTLSNTADT
ncbi:Glucose-6-phosphate exchanger SLC37A2 [Schistosoma japonicum]|nr:Glucose-6-phosphate exchanger SLC37A2 [Schistosoma japonicum]